MNADTPQHTPEEIEARITAMLLGELTPAEEAEVRRTIEGDPDLARLHDRLKHAIELVRDAVTQPAEAAAAQQSLPQLSGERRQMLLQRLKTVHQLDPPRRRGAPWFVPMSIAAVLMALLTLGGLVSWNGLTSSQPKAVTLVEGMGETASRSLGVDRLQISGAAPQTEPLNRAPASPIYLPGQTDADKPVEVAQNVKLSAESGKNERAKPTALGPSLTSRNLDRNATDAKKEPGGQLDTPPIPENRPVISSFLEVGLPSSVNGQSVADNAETTAQLNSFAVAPPKIAKVGDAPQLGWMFATPAGTPEFESGKSVKTGSLPGEVPALRVDALEIPTKTEFFAPDLQDGNLSRGVSPNVVSDRTARIWDTATAKPAGGVEVGSLVQAENLVQAEKGETPAPIITSIPAQSAPALPANALPGAAETEDLSIHESVLKTQAGAPAGGTSDSALAERSKSENSKQDGLEQPLSAGKPTEGFNARNSSPEEEAPRPSFMEPRMMMRYFGGKLPPGYPGGQASGKKGSLEKMSDEKGALAAPQVANISRQKEQITNLPVLGRALKRNEESVDFAKAISSEEKNVTQLGQIEKDKLAKRPLAELEFRANRLLSSTNVIDRNSDAFRYAGGQATNAADALSRTRTVDDVVQPDSARAVNRPPPPEPQPEVPTQENGFSTFSLNVTDVSFKLAAASLEKGVLPEPATVRSEEFINAFNYHDPEPAPGVPVAFAWERAQYPFAHNRDLIRFAVRTAARGREAGRPLNLVLLLDNSGSMERADRVRIIRETLVVLARQLQPQDRVSVVAFARTARLWVDALPGSQAGELAERVGNLTPEGGTNLEEALNLAYATAARHFLSQGVNRVVLLTDGAANLGDIDPESLQQKVESWRQRGVALDCFGIGWEGYNDDLLEVLSRKGDGRYGFVNTPEEATTEFAAQVAGALHVAASDVKVQVEFNAGRVAVWRQIGYAKHQLTKEQFRDNAVDAAELAAAESGNALYSIQVDPNGAGPICVVRVRYREPDSGIYREHEWPVPYTGAALPLDRASATLRLAAAASAFSEWLVSSPFAGEVTPDRLLTYLQGVPAAFEPDPRPQKLEWMIRQAKSISGK